MNKTENAFYIVGLLLALALVLLVFAACVIPVGAWDGDDGYPVEGYPVAESGYPVEPKTDKTGGNTTAYPVTAPVAYPVEPEANPVEVSDPQPKPVGTPEPTVEPETVGKPAPIWTPEPVVWLPKYIAVFEWGVLAEWMK